MLAFHAAGGRAIARAAAADCDARIAARTPNPSALWRFYPTQKNFPQNVILRSRKCGFDQKRANRGRPIRSRAVSPAQWTPLHATAETGRREKIVRA
jgi:hypothetical protein